MTGKLMKMEPRWNDTERRNSQYSEKNLSQCHLFTTNPILTALDLIPDLCVERPAKIA
jgi:hypothetical protein